MAQVFQQSGTDRTLLRAATPGPGGTELRGVRSFVADGVNCRSSLLPPPAYNAHGREILMELGYQGTRLRRLLES
jgi:hypothetical protein